MNPGLPSQLAPPFERLAGRLREVCRDRPVLLFSNPGNWGDALIREGTRRFLRDIQIPYTEVFANRQFRIAPGSVLLYGGGGGWCTLWHHSPNILERIGRRFEHTVVLPSTFEGHYELEKTDFYARDRYESTEHMPGATFCHDMAFYIGRVDGQPGDGEGFFFRTDAERVGSLPGPASANVDISSLGTHLTPVEGFFAQVARFSSVHTDRLHVAIAAALLGRELHFHPGSYFKNRAVFRSSFEKHFDRVHFETAAQ